MDDIFAPLVYSMCFLTSAACAWLLGRSYARVRARLLLWSALCFGLLAIQNLFVILDLLVLPDVNLQLVRLGLACAAVGTLLYGFIWDLEEA